MLHIKAKAYQSKNKIKAKDYEANKKIRTKNYMMNEKYILMHNSRKNLFYK